MRVWRGGGEGAIVQVGGKEQGEAGGERGSRDGRGRGVCTTSYSTFGYRVPGLTAMSLLIASDSEELWQAA